MYNFFILNSVILIIEEYLEFGLLFFVLFSFLLVFFDIGFVLGNKNYKLK